MLREFKEFILRGSVVDLAVGFVIGAAFASVVTALVADLITPLIAAIGAQPDFSGLTFTINSSRFLYGHFLNALISFVVIAAAIFFLVVKPVNAYMSRHPKEAETKECPECLSEIPAGATRCSYCCIELAAQS